LFDYIPVTLKQRASDVCVGGAAIPWPVFRTLACGVLTALLHLQNHHVVHLDVKMDNILVDTSDDDVTRHRAVLCDFGCAHRTTEDNALETYVCCIISAMLRGVLETSDWMGWFNARHLMDWLKLTSLMCWFNARHLMDWFKLTSLMGWFNERLVLRDVSDP
jgi:serine/threonine protein kinase